MAQVLMDLTENRVHFDAPNRQARLNLAYVKYREWCLQHGQRPTPSQRTCDERDLASTPSARRPAIATCRRRGVALRGLHSESSQSEDVQVAHDVPEPGERCTNKTPSILGGKLV